MPLRVARKPSCIFFWAMPDPLAEVYGALPSSIPKQHPAGLQLYAVGKQLQRMCRVVSVFKMSVCISTQHGWWLRAPSVVWAWHLWLGCALFMLACVLEKVVVAVVLHYVYIHTT